MAGRLLGVAIGVGLAACGAVAPAFGHEAHVAQGSAPGPRAASAPESCPGAAIQPDRVITGEFGTDLSRSYVMLPFEVPRSTTAVRVKYCFDQPEALISTPAVSARHTLDLGLYEPRRDTSRTWGVPEFRGWGGSSHPDVTVSPEGFSTEEQYLAKPRVDPPGKTTRAFLPGAIRSGEWAVELGVAAVVPRSLGDTDEKVAWRVEIDLAQDPAFADEPYEPAPYDNTPARRDAGWYSGDMHVHADHSAYGDATMREVFDYAYRPLAQGGAGLDFVTLSDYVSGSSWGEVGRHQPRYPGKLAIRSAEVITYRGHLNNHNTARVVDYREGPIYERAADGSLKQVRGRRPPSETFADIKRAGGFTQINHPTIFPSSVPSFDLFCRGCPWDYDAAETRYDRVDAIEVATGPSGARSGSDTQGPNPFTVTAIDFYERALAAGNRIAAVGVSDSHNAGRTPGGATQAPIGEATTVVRAEELSASGIECGVKAGHTYVKVTGNAGPDLRFEAGPPGWKGAPAIFGDTVRGSSARFTARVTGGDGRTLIVYRNGEAFRSVPVTGNEFTTAFDAAGAGRYRLQLQRGSSIESVSSPIYFSVGAPAVLGRDCRPLRVRGKARRRIRVSRRGRFLTRCAASGAGLNRCSVAATIRTGPKGRRTVRKVAAGRVLMSGGSRRVQMRLTQAGRRVLRIHGRRGRRVRVVFTAVGAEGATAQVAKRSRLVRPTASRRVLRPKAPRKRGLALAGSVRR